LSQKDDTLERLTLPPTCIKKRKHFNFLTALRFRRRLQANFSTKKILTRFVHNKSPVWCVRVGVAVGVSVGVAVGVTSFFSSAQ
jgi:hypothetical protein